MAMEYQGSGAGHLPTRSGSSQHWAIYDQGRGVGGCRQFPLVCGLLPCFAAGQCGHVWTVVGMACGEDTRGRSVPTGPCILGRNWRPAHHVLHEILLGASPEGYIQKEGEGPSSLCDYFCGRHSHMSTKP